MGARICGSVNRVLFFGFTGRTVVQERGPLGRAFLEVI